MDCHLANKMRAFEVRLIEWRKHSVPRMIGKIDFRLLDFCPPTKPITTEIFWLRAEVNLL